jgi:hypothetical protein
MTDTPSIEDQSKSPQASDSRVLDWLEKEISVAQNLQKGLGQEKWGTVAGIGALLWLVIDQNKELTFSSQTVALFVLFSLILDGLEILGNIISPPTPGWIVKAKRVQLIRDTPGLSRESLVFASMKVILLGYLIPGGGVFPWISKILLWLAAVSLFGFLALTFLPFPYENKQTKRSGAIKFTWTIFVLLCFIVIERVVSLGSLATPQATDIKIALSLAAIFWLVRHGLVQRSNQPNLGRLINLRRELYSGFRSPEKVKQEIEVLYFGAELDHFLNNLVTDIKNALRVLTEDAVKHVNYVRMMSEQVDPRLNLEKAPAKLRKGLINSLTGGIRLFAKEHEKILKRCTAITSSITDLENRFKIIIALHPTSKQTCEAYVADAKDQLGNCRTLMATTGEMIVWLEGVKQEFIERK